MVGRNRQQEMQQMLSDWAVWGDEQSKLQRRAEENRGFVGRNRDWGEEKIGKERKEKGESVGWFIALVVHSRLLVLVIPFPVLC